MIHENPVRERELECQISALTATTTALAKANQKNRLRKAFAELAKLKAQRSLATIHGIEAEKGIGGPP